MNYKYLMPPASTCSCGRHPPEELDFFCVGRVYDTLFHWVIKSPMVETIGYSVSRADGTWEPTF
ncbi:hypothetical protein ABHV44_04610 [Flavobacteriales bacterium DA487]